MDKIFRQSIAALIIQILFVASLSGQKYQNGTRLLKGAEVLSATPLQLDYVLENIADTAKIKVNIHEGKTHLVLNDGTGKWHEWWYFMGKWQLKQNGGPSGLESSIQAKHNDGFAGSILGINEGFLYSLDETPSDVGINNKNATIRVTPQSKAVMEATKTTANGNITSNVIVSGDETEQNISWISQNPRNGAHLRMDTTMLEHWQTSAGLDFWNFKSSLPDTTFYVKKRIRFDQPNTSVYVKNGDLRLTDKTGDFALEDLVNKAETDPSVPSHVKNITNTNITNWNAAYTNSHTHSNKTVLDGIAATNITNWNNAFSWENHAAQGYLKVESDPVWTAAQGNYFTKNNLQTSGQAMVHWDNITSKPAMGAGSVTSVGLSMPNIFSVTGSPVSSSGTLAATLANQTKNTVLAAPTTANGTPSFRTLQETDLPSMNWSKLYNTPSTLSNYGITNAYTKTETNALLDIAGESCQMLMLHNKHPLAIPHTCVQNSPSNTQFTFYGYDKIWEHPDILYPASMMVDATGFDFGGSWLNYRTHINTRSGQLYFRVDNDDYPEYFSHIIMESGRLYQHAYHIELQAHNFSVESEHETKKNTFWTTPEVTKTELRNQVGELNYHTDFIVENGNMSFTKSIEKEYNVYPHRWFYVNDNFSFDRYLNYTTFDTTLRVLNAVNLTTIEDENAARIAITDDKDIQFSSKATQDNSTVHSITLTEIIQKGQIITQATEPDIPEGSFAFWVNGSNFYMILRSNGLQKKLLMQ